MVDDGIDGNRRLTGLTVSDNQLTLSTADRNHGIDSLQSGLQRFGYRLTEDNSRSLAFQRHFIQFAAYLAPSVQGNSQRVDDTSQHAFSHLDGSDTLGTLHNHPLLDTVCRAQKYGSHIILLQVHHGTHDTVFELQQFIGFGITQAIDTCYTVAHLQNGTHFVKFQ